MRSSIKINKKRIWNLYICEQEDLSSWNTKGGNSKTKIKIEPINWNTKSNGLAYNYSIKEKRSNRTDEIFKEIMAENFWKLKTLSKHTSETFKDQQGGLNRK